jgi:hypothetical protein
MSGVYGYDWSVDGRSAIQVPSSETEERGYIDCPRGTRAGKACMYLRSVDAAFIVAAGTEVTIKCVVKKTNQSDQWEIEKTVEWKGYIATECSAIDDSENCWVTFYDKRIHLERASIDRIFNSLFLMTWETGGTTQHKIYDPDYCQASNVPYTFEEILDELFALTSLTTPSLPVTPDSPDNIHAHGSVADVLAGLLATQGCDLLFNPFADELTIILLSDNQDTEAITEAIDEGRLVANEVFTLSDEDKHGIAEIWPRDWYPIRTVESDTATFGTGERVICIRDHELANETTRKVLAARKTEISTACAAWFTAEGDIRDETYYGVIEQPPGEEIRQVQWWLPDETGYQSTRIINNAVPMPWVKRVEHFYPPCLRGKTTTEGLGITVPELVEYWESIEDGAYEDSGYFVYAISVVSEIDPEQDVVMWATEYKWLAVRVC